MKFYLVILLLLFVNFANAQSQTAKELSVQNYMMLSRHQPDLTFLDDLRDSKIISVRTTNEFFNKSYLISKNGDALSTCYLSSSNFVPNDNLIVVSGQNIRQRDSFMRTKMNPSLPR